MSRALVISGGGSKGAFAVGVLKKLLSSWPGLSFDTYVGTSTGSLMAPLAAMEKYDLLETLYSNQKTENIIRKFNIGDRLSEHSIFDANPLWDLINTYYTDDNYNELQASGKKIYLNATCLQSGNLVVFTNNPHPALSNNYETKVLINADHFRRAVMASACQPVFMPPVKVNQHVPGEPHPQYQFVDGGVREYAGVQMAIDNGATEIFTILLSVAENKPDEVEFKTLFPILEQTLDIFMTDVAKNDLVIPGIYNEALEYIADVKDKMLQTGVKQSDIDSWFNTGAASNPFIGKKPIKLYGFRPLKPLGGGPGGLNFDVEEMKNMIAAGQQIANDFIAALTPADISWA
ncbi:MAG: patatin-like phospholipase family protein [Ferruginibacter sp.]